MLRTPTDLYHPLILLNRVGGFFGGTVFDVYYLRNYTNKFLKYLHIIHHSTLSGRIAQTKFGCLFFFSFSYSIYIHIHIHIHIRIL